MQIKQYLIYADNDNKEAVMTEKQDIKVESLKLAILLMGAASR